MKKKICIVLVGPTAVGKTQLAIEMARHFNTSIISADSRQCFRELNIGVAKPSNEQLEIVRHYFINSHSIHEEVTAATFEQYALGAVEEIFQQADVAVMAGGTGLYVKAFCAGMDKIPEISNEVRQNILLQFERHGLGWLQEEVRMKDPEYAALGEMQNPQRMMRALEVKLFTGASIRFFQQGKKAMRDFHVIKVGLDLPRKDLYQRINLRVEEMITRGLVEEVISLLPFERLNPLLTVGYSELFAFLEGNISIEKAVEDIKKNTRHYAKRQLTWFRRDAAIRWYSPLDPNQVITDLQNLVQELLFKGHPI